jgi:hypothetical protein
MRESGLDSWCACVLSIEDAATARPMISQMAHQYLTQCKYSLDLWSANLVDVQYFQKNW